MSMLRSVIGIDIGGTNTKFGIVDASGDIVHQGQEPTSRISANAVLKRAAECVQRLLDIAEKNDTTIEGIGVAVTGQVDVSRGAVAGGIYGKIRGWIGTPVREFFSEKFGLPVEVDNDGNTAILGEYVFHRKDECKDMIMLTIGTGVGTGIILDGRLFRGGNGNIGSELGHMVIDPNGPICQCGNRGCLEAFVSGEAISERYSGLICRNQRVPGRTDPDAIGRAYVNGDKNAAVVVKEVAEYIGTALGNACNLLGPEMVVVGGGISGIGTPLINHISERIGAISFGLSRNNFQIEAARLGTYAGVFGAATLVMSDYSSITSIDNRG